MTTQYILGGVHVWGAQRNQSFSTGSAGERLQQHARLEALYSTADLQSKVGYTGTRGAFLARCQSYADPEKPTIVLVKGSANVGKTTAMYMLCARLASEKRLLATFFHPDSVAGPRTIPHSSFIITLALQLYNAIPPLRPFIDSAMDRDITITNKDIDTQLDALLLKPLNEYLADKNGIRALGLPHAIVVDGLGPDRQQRRRLIQVLTRLASSSPLPLTIYISTRPYYGLPHTFNASAMKPLIVMESLDTEQDAEADVRNFIAGQLRNSFARHNFLSPSPAFWPDHKHLTQLVHICRGSLSFADAILRFIDDDFADPEERLQMILNQRPLGDLKPFRKVDTKYTEIVASAITTPADRLPMLRVLAILSTQYTTTDEGDVVGDEGSNNHTLRCQDPRFVEGVLGLPSRQCQRLLRGLESVLTVTLDHEPVKMDPHFQEFLRDKERAGDLHVPSDVIHSLLLTSLVERDLGGQDDAIREFARLNFHLLFDHQRPSPKLLKTIQDMNFLNMARNATPTPGTGTTGFSSLDSWINVCDAFLQALSDSNFPQKRHLYTAIFPSFRLVVEQAIHRVYFSHPALWFLLYASLDQGTSYVPREHQLPSNLVDMERQQGFYLVEGSTSMASEPPSGSIVVGSPRKLKKPLVDIAARILAGCSSAGTLPTPLWRSLTLSKAIKHFRSSSYLPSFFETHALSLALPASEVLDELACSLVPCLDHLQQADPNRGAIEDYLQRANRRPSLDWEAVIFPIPGGWVEQRRHDRTVFDLPDFGPPTPSITTLVVLAICWLWTNFIHPYY